MICPSGRFATRSWATVVILCTVTVIIKVKAGGWFGKMVKCQDAKTAPAMSAPSPAATANRAASSSRSQTEYYPFRDEGHPARRQARCRGGQRFGGTPAIRAGNGGLDANWLVRHRVPTVTVGTGQNEPHMIDEWINRDEYERAGAGGAAGDDG